MTAGFSRQGLGFSIMNKDDNDSDDDHNSDDFGSGDDDDDDDDDSVRIIIDYTPSNPKLKPMDVYLLPPLPAGSQIQYLAMSSLPIRDKDWVVGVKLWGSRVSFCKPYGSSQWVDVNTKPQSLHPYASIMFSKNDQRFYVPTPGGNYLFSLDPNSKQEEDQLKFIDLEFNDLPNSVLNDFADVSSCSKTDHLVESPAGQLFLVRWYITSYPPKYYSL